MKIKNIVMFLLIILASIGFVLAIAELPPYGMPDNPIHNGVYDRYVGDAISETGSINIVTSIVLDYRAYDTMFETIVLFTATIASVITLKIKKRRERQMRDFVLKRIACILLPFISLFGIYVIVHGHTSAGALLQVEYCSVSALLHTQLFTYRQGAGEAA